MVTQEVGFSRMSFSWFFRTSFLMNQYSSFIPTNRFWIDNRHRPGQIHYQGWPTSLGSVTGGKPRCAAGGWLWITALPLMAFPDQGNISSSTKQSQQMTCKEVMPLRNHSCDTHLAYFVDKETKLTKVGEEPLRGSTCFYISFGKWAGKECNLISLIFFRKISLSTVMQIKQFLLLSSNSGYLWVCQKPKEVMLSCGPQSGEGATR